MRPRPFACLSLALIVCLSGCSTTSTAPAATPTHLALPTPRSGSLFSASLVTDVGGLHDGSFNQEAWSGLRRAHTQLGILVSARESRSEAQYLPNLERAAQRHATVTVAVGYSMSRAVYDAALALPQARFLLVDARPIDPSGREVSLPNVENLLFREQESGYVAGVVAGDIESHRIDGATHNTVGYLAGPSIPQVDHYVAGFVAGVEAADHGVRMVSQTVASFTDPVSGRQIADDQIAAGADTVFQVAGQTGAAYLQEAQRRHALVIGVDADMRYLGSRVVTSAIKKVDVAVFKSVRDTEHRHFRSGDVRLGAAQGATGIAPFAAFVPMSIRAAAQTVLLRIASGRLTPPLVPPAR